METLEGLYEKNEIHFPGIKEFTRLEEIREALRADKSNVIILCGGRDPQKSYGLSAFRQLFAKELWAFRPVIMNVKKGTRLEDRPYWPFVYGQYMMVFPLENVCLVLKAQSLVFKYDLLHNEKGPAVVFDDCEFWFLCGIKIPKMAVLDKEMAAALWLETQNVEVRKVLGTHLGSTTELFRHLGGNLTVLDKETLKIPTPDDSEAEHIYELWEIDLKLQTRHIGIQSSKRRALHMRNPSVKELHTEWVSSQCNTVLEALDERNQSRKHGIETLPSLIS